MQHLTVDTTTRARRCPADSESHLVLHSKGPSKYNMLRQEQKANTVVIGICASHPCSSRSAKVSHQRWQARA